MANPGLTLPRASEAEHSPFLTKGLLVVLFLWFTLCGVTMTAGDPGQGDVGGRLAPPDLVMLILAPMGIWFAVKRKGLILPRMAFAALIMNLAFIIGVPTSTQPFTTFFECVVHLYAFLGFAVVYVIMRSLGMEERLKMHRLWAIGSIIISLFGFYDLFSLFLGLPGMGVIGGDVTGTFRNAGQAGQYFLMAVSAIFPWYRVVEGKEKRLATVALFLLILACVLTVKRSAVIALAVGLALAVLMETDWGRMARMASVMGVFALLGLGIWNQVSQVSWVFDSRVERKTGEGAAERLGGFAEHNVEVADLATKRNMLTGVGIGGVAGYYAKHEIHSGYFGILVNSGVVGFVIYCWFLWEYFLGLANPRNKDKRSRAFSNVALAMGIGMSIGWVYTLQVRKREFWASAGLVFGVLAPLPESRKSESDPEELPEA